ncbi:MAG: type B chloramphenicol O-acetyltransferase, partial [Acidaminococcaceae bacterium]
VTKDVAPYAIVAGVPAKTIKKRFSDTTVAELLKIKWWDWQPEKVRMNLDAIIKGKVEQLK